MAGETVQFAKNDDADNKREQSSIVFPYLDLNAAIKVANAIYQRSGLGSCDLDELAAQMNQTMSGAFRLNTGTAKIFDLVDKEGKSSIKLTELGRQIVSPDTERAARAEAFMRVPLYAAIFDKYKGHLLPPAKALEREMLSLGVSSKQTDKARQAFERSARQANFFESGEDRLVRPRTDLPTKRIDVDDSDHSGSGAEIEKQDAGKSGGGGSGGGLHPFIEGLLRTLPEPETAWSTADQAKWLQTAASIFGLIYRGDGQPISVTLPSASKENGG